MMELVVIELILWIGLIFFFWALKDSLGHVESDIETVGLLKTRKIPAPSDNRGYVRPDKVTEPIGSYKDMQIYRYAVIAGKNYQFDHVCPSEEEVDLTEGQCCVMPGLVYVECSDQQSRAEEGKAFER